MPTVFLSPSLQEYNPYVGGGNEEYYMNLIVDAMIPYLVSSGIRYERNSTEQTLSQAIAESNEGNYDLHFALHSNAAPAALEGQIKGTDVYYYPDSEKSKEFADILVQNFKKIYPNPSLVKAVPTTRLAEVTRTRAPAVLMETAYHDNVEDAQWIRENIENIAKNLVESLTEYFGIPFIAPQEERIGTVTTNVGVLNIRSKPTTDSAVITQAPKGSKLTVIGQFQDWYLVEYDGNLGYAKSNYITV